MLSKYSKGSVISKFALLLIIDNDFKEYIDLITKDLSKNPDDTSKKNLE